MSTHLLSSSLDGAWANRATNGRNCSLWEADTQQFATHYRGKKHKASIALALKAKRQMPMTQFFSAAAAPAPPTDDDAPPPGDIEAEHGVSTSPGADGSALALGADWNCTGALPLGVPNANALRGQYPVMRHAHEKVHWRYFNGMGTVSVNPPCTGVAPVGESGEKLPCSSSSGRSSVNTTSSSTSISNSTSGSGTSPAKKKAPAKRGTKRDQLRRAAIAIAITRAQPKSSQFAASARSRQQLPKLGRPRSRSY